VNLFNLLAANARRFPDEPAVFAGDRRFATWRELHARALAISGGLALERGARVVIASKNCPEYVELLFACWAAGAIAVPVNAKLHVREIADIIESSGAATVFASPALAAGLGGAIPIGGDRYAELLAAAPRHPVDVSAETPAWLFYTSGTTGKPKGAVLTHRNLMAMTVAHLADFEELRHTDALLHAAPMSHGSGLYILPYVARAARQVVIDGDGFDPGTFLDLCDVHPGAGAFLAPTMVRRVRAEAEQRGGPPKGLRSIMYGGAPMYLEEQKRCLRVFGAIFRQLYGQGEAPMTITGLNRDDHLGDNDVLGSVGWPRSGVEVAILDADNSHLPAGEIGEIACRGDIVMSCYWNDPKATAATIRDGWLLTGDVGFLGEDGKLTLRDRSKDVIISGGTNIYPREVEEALLSFPGIAEVCVVGAPDEEWGEVVVAFVVTAEGAIVDDAGLDAHCLSRIARFKRPKRYVFIDALPKSSYGKVLKRELVERMRKG